MSDGLERRALLVQTGEALKAVSGKPGKGAGALAARAALEGRSAGDAALALAQAFASWPTLLLAEKFDRKALAKSVSTVFSGNPSGWKAYLKATQKDVPGFGEGIVIEAAPAVSAAEVKPEAEGGAASEAGQKPLAEEGAPATIQSSQVAGETAAEGTTDAGAAASEVPASGFPLSATEGSSSGSSANA
jgi:hypothetical protein